MTRLAILSSALLLAAPLLAAAAAPAPRIQTADLLIVHARVVSVDADFTILEDGAVAILGDAIADVGPTADVVRRVRAKETFDAKGAILMPGLVNTHNHAAMTLLRGGADDRALMDWLTNFIFPAEGRNVSPAFVRDGTRLACLEMIRSGTTTFADMYYFEDEVAKVVDEAGMRGVLGETVIGFPVPDAPTPEKGLEGARAFIARWRKHPRIVPAVAPHAPYTVPPEILKACEALSKETNTPLLIHVAETRDEDNQVREKFGKRPVEFLDSLGVLSPRTVAAHCVWLSRDDIATMAKAGAGCSHNPESNMKLASGSPPVAAMLAGGLRVGLGTDGAASNNDLDMFDAMDLAGKLAKLVTGDPRALPARAVVEMATRRGAELLGLGEKVGSIETGKQADLVLVSVDSPKATPLWDVPSLLVSALDGDDVRRVWVAGRLLYRDGTFLTLDEKAIRAKAEEWRTKIRASLAPTPEKAK